MRVSKPRLPHLCAYGNSLASQSLRQSRRGVGDPAGAVAKADAYGSLPPATAPHHDVITVLEETAGLAGGERQWRRAAAGQFEEGAERVAGGAGDGAAGEQVTRSVMPSPFMSAAARQYWLPSLKR